MNQINGQNIKSAVGTDVDMIDERSWILRTAVPKLQEFARKSNLDFQLVDLRWGVAQETAYEPENLPVYLEQIEFCRRISSGPFFVVSRLREGWG